jgi:hypothetical protein
VPMPKITISLDDDLLGELAQAARDEGTTEAELAANWIKGLLHSRLAGLEMPHFARRLGPLAFPEPDPLQNDVATET